MAQSFQNVTLSLTLPISCQICLGKVRQPVICSNNHVFCATCIEVWLKQASQCPTCRVPITPENPCKEIIGATNDAESNESHLVKKRLRKTRGELLLREYEDEIEILLKENEDLRGKNLNLETQLKTVLDPSTVSVSNTEAKVVDPSTLEEWANKLRAANDLYKRVKQDMEKIKEANKTLRAQNVDLIQENMRLKAEVENRSPQKFGRYTVAALEAKINQYERDVTHLKRALERSDKYIEELEAQVPVNQREASGSKDDAHSESTAAGERGAGGTGVAERSAIVTMRRSLSEMGETSVRTDLGGNPEDVPYKQGLLLATTSDPCRGRCFQNEAVTPRKGQAGVGDVGMKESGRGSLSPSTPSSALSCLSLKSPVVVLERKADFKPLTYLRRLNFEDCCGSDSSSASVSGHQSSNARGGTSLSQRSKVTPQKDVLWGGWEDPGPSEPSHQRRNERTPTAGTSSSEGHEGRVTDAFRASSEESMDAAYLDKISELDSMISEGEGSNGQKSHLSLMLPGSSDFGSVPEPEAHAGVMTDLSSGSSHQGLIQSHESSERMSNDAIAGSAEGMTLIGTCGKDRGTVENPRQSTKRRCHSALSISSPSKLFKPT
ncbi:RING finger protein 219 [Chanos chanos]|uniref:RING finger protein 219 n=1 Tax=Chanos chanos TaxID=29144 RepID=A0A6J2VXC8_CHACN|nr:RING finger protein 219 [Chanos chanos]